MKNKFKITANFIDNNIPLFIFSMFYYGLIIFLAWYLNIWEDEVYSLNTSSGTLSYAYRQSIHFDLQPPVYFLTLTLWRTISDSVFWARLLSVVLIFLSQILLYRFARSFSNKKMASALTILFLLNPVTVFLILEIRTFSMVLFLSLFILVSFYEMYCRDNITTVKRIIFILISILGLFTQYYIGFLLFANAVVLLMMKNWKSLRSYILDMIIPLCLILLYIPAIQSNLGVKFTSVPEYTRTLSGFLTDVKGLISQVTFIYFLPSSYIDSNTWLWIFRGSIIILLIATLNHVGLKKCFHELIPFITIFLVITFFFIVVLCFFGKYAVEYKYTILLFVPLLILMLFILKNIKPGLLIVWLILFAFIYLIQDFQKYQGLYKVKDFRSLSDYIEHNEEKEEPIFVHRNITAENMGFYYKGKNQIIPVPEIFSYDKAFTPEQWEITAQDIDELNNRLIKYCSFYVVIDNSPLRGVTEAKTVLLEFLEQNYNLQEMKPFNGKLDLYKFSGRSEPDDPKSPI